MQFNQYNMYSYMVENFSHMCDEKILVDLQRFQNLVEYDEVKELVDKVFGTFENSKIFEYPNNIKVIIQKEENVIKIGALQNNKEIFGKGWRYLEDED